jgi:hypothetical protein
VKETRGNFWDVARQYDGIVVTTNGHVKNNGHLVMGKGLAKQFFEHFPEVPKILGDKVTQFGNFPFPAGRPKGFGLVLSLPTQPHWRVKSTYEFVLEQCANLVKLVDKCKTRDENAFTDVLTVQPGCGLGGLEWRKLKPDLRKIWDDRFTVIRP